MCFYANTCSKGSNQEKLEVCMQLQGYNLIGIRESQWDKTIYRQHKVQLKASHQWLASGADPEANAIYHLH